MDDGNGKNIEGNKVKEWDWDRDGFNEWIRDRKNETVRERDAGRQACREKDREKIIEDFIQTI